MKGVQKRQTVCLMDVSGNTGYGKASYNFRNKSVLRCITEQGFEKIMKKIGIGYENYQKLIDDNCYYVDKTMFIEDIVRKGGMVTLFTRPRRFGKTLTLSMLRTFFEYGYDLQGNLINAKHYFEGKRIMQADPEILSMMGKYPVINLTLKSAKQTNFRAAFLKLRDEIASEYRRHGYLLHSDRLDDTRKQMFSRMVAVRKEEEIDTDEKLKIEVDKYSTSLKLLSECLAVHHEIKVIILLDEYDVPLENAYYSGFYNEMTAFIRSLFESALKTNDFLEFAVVTGCLCISKKSIFTGLNNLKINSIRNDNFAEGFGFTEKETEEFLQYYGIGDRIPEAKEWYNGYLFGKREIYNPWSITNYVEGIVNDGKEYPEAYWSNTSSNSIIKDLIDHAGTETKKRTG